MQKKLAKAQAGKDDVLALFVLFSSSSCFHLVVRNRAFISSILGS